MMEFFLTRQQTGSFLTDMSAWTYRILILLFFIFVVGCAEKDEGGKSPFIQLNSGSNVISCDTAISPGQLMHFDVTAQKGDYNITHFLIRVKSDSSQVYYDTGMNITAFNWAGAFAKSFEDNEVWEFIVRDRYSRSDIISILIQNDSLAGPGPINTYTDIILGAQSNNSHGGCFSLYDKLVYFINEAYNNQEIIDMIYYYGEDDQTIASPGANIEDGIFQEEYIPNNWLYRNTTRFINTSMIAEEFNHIQNDSILLVSYVEGEGKRKAKNLETGDIYSFKTQDAKYGIFLVTEILGSESGTVKIDIKIQE